MKEVVITPENGLEAISHNIKSMRKNARMTWELGSRMFLRDMRALYRQSLLGYAWIIFPPIANTLIWVYLNDTNVITINTGTVAYPIFVLTGNLLWAAFNGSLSGMLNAVNESRSLISKINFPHEALLLSSFGKATVNSMIPMLLLVPVLPFYLDTFHPVMLLFPVGAFALMLLGSTIAILLLPIATLFADVSRAVQLILRFAFFLTPVVYPLPQSGIAKIISDLNPVTPLLVTTRNWIVGEGPILLQPFLIIVGITIIALIAGIVIYKISIPYLIERLSS